MSKPGKIPNSTTFNPNLGKTQNQKNIAFSQAGTRTALSQVLGKINGKYKDLSGSVEVKFYARGDDNSFVIDLKGVSGPQDQIDGLLDDLRNGLNSYNFNGGDPSVTMTYKFNIGD